MTYPRKSNHRVMHLLQLEVRDELQFIFIEVLHLHSELYVLAFLSYASRTDAHGAMRNAVMNEIDKRSTEIQTFKLQFKSATGATSWRRIQTRAKKKRNCIRGPQ